MICFRCAKCREQIDCPSSMAGDVLECPSCGNVNTVPGDATPMQRDLRSPAGLEPDLFVFKAVVLKRGHGKRRFEVEQRATSEEHAAVLLGQFGYEVLGFSRTNRRECVPEEPGQSMVADSPIEVPPALTSRPDRSPSTAAILNFFFWGAGYIYAGRSWGLAILIPTIAVSMLFLAAGLGNPEESSASSLALFLFGLPVDFAFAWHAYQLVSEDRARWAERP